MGKNVTTVGILSTVVALLLGIFGGNYISDTGNATLVAEKDSTITDLEAQLDSIEPTIINNTEYVDVANAELFLNNAISDAWDKELSDDDRFLTCNSVTYDEDEVELSKVKTWAYHWISDDEYSVYLEAKYKFDSTNDDDRCTATRIVTVAYEDGEKPVVNWS